MNALNIRPGTPADVPAILDFIRELAFFEREPDAVIATEADLLRDGFCLAPDGVTKLTNLHSPRFTCIIADWTEQGITQPAGFALYFTSYSTWLGHHGIRLEDLYVTPDLRGQGIGKALLARLARIAVDQGCPRLEWDVLNWNQSAIDVYEAIGAKAQSAWTIMRLSGPALVILASEAV
jgi:GNAT superfamily N-acetyltransferase